MGSFLTYVVVKGDQKDVEAKVTQLLVPYDKALQVAEYEGRCPCVHAQVKDKAREMARERASSIADENQPAFQRVTKYAMDYQEAQKAAIQELLDKATPDPNCKDCGGSGTIKTTANPNGKWTHWEIGVNQPGFVLAECLTDVPDDFNIVPVKLVNLQEVPTASAWAIITPDGKWHAAGEPYWFGSSRIDDRDWDNTARKILQQHGDKALVVVECQS